MQDRIMYIEQKTGQSRAFIGKVKFSKTGKTLYYRDIALSRAKRGGICGNYYGYDKESFEEWQNTHHAEGGFPPNFIGEFWVSGPHKDGQDRLGSEGRTTPVIHIDEDVREQYWTKIRNQPEKINETKF